MSRSRTKAARSPGVDRTVEELPATGIDEMMEGAVHLFDVGGEPNTLSALAIEIPPRHSREAGLHGR